MSDPEEREGSVDPLPETPLDQTTGPPDRLQEGLTGEVPLDQTLAEMRKVMGSEGGPPIRRRPLG
jgi:hypothetical protein